MPRRSSQSFRCPALEELTRQLLFAPPERRAQQILRAERLHDQVEADIAYPLEFVVYRITGYRSDYQQEELLRGSEIAPDLRLMIDKLSYVTELPSGVAGDEPLETAGELASRLNVNRRTLQRWRELGLRWRWVRSGEQGTRRSVYPRRAVEGFLQNHREQVEKAGHFTHLPPEARDELLRRARRLAQARDVTLHQVAVHLARRTGRAVETLRQLLIKHDKSNPGEAIFVDRGGPLSQQDRTNIVQAVERGVPLAEVCRQFRRTRSTIYRAVNEAKAAKLRKVPIRYTMLPTFTRSDADEVYLSPLGEDDHDGAGAPAVGVEDLPEPIQKVYVGPTMSAERVQQLLIRFNYLRYRAARFRDALTLYEPRVSDIAEVGRSLEQATALRNQLIHATLPLALAAVRRHVVGSTDTSTRRVVDLLEEANLVLFDCIDKFDITGNTRFESYLNWTLMRHLAIAEAHAAESGAGKAHKREEPARMLHRLIEKAGESGVDLKLDEES